MSVEIEPRYEILYNDLVNHSIGNYLISREFKIVMSQNNYYDAWKNTYEKVKNERGYFSIGMDHHKYDSIDTLVVYLNATHKIAYLEEVITLIISDFIKSKKSNEDFTDVIESMIIAKFSESSINKVKESYEEHLNKNLPSKAKVNSKTKEKSQNMDLKNQTEIFIVHGHNEVIKEKVARTIERLKLKPIILNEQTDEGLTIIEKFEKYSNVNFAIVLLTYDDFGNNKTSEEKNKRARQNVILELGYFIGKLGRSRVLPLYEKDVELPSDFSGVLYTIIDDSENWKIRIVKELKAAGYQVDANDVL